jgi:hypothetical protein
MKKLYLAFILLITCQQVFCQSLGLQFDGVDDVATAPHISAYDIGQGDFTFEAWIEGSSAQIGIPIIYGNRSTTITGFLVMLYNGVFAMRVGGFNYLSDQNYLYDNTCHHVAGTRLNGILTLYLDGSILPFASGFGSSAPHDITDNHTIWIGLDEPNPNTKFNGVIHEIRMWNLARTQAEIQSSMNVYLSGNEPGLIGYWKMNEGSGQIINDLSTNQNNGVLGYTSGAETSDPVFSQGCALSGINDLTAENEMIHVFPNPFSSFLTINFTNKKLQVTSICITDITGKMVYSKADSELNKPDLQIDTENLSEGMYFVILNNKTFIKVIKE